MLLALPLGGFRQVRRLRGNPAIGNITATGRVSAGRPGRRSLALAAGVAALALVAACGSSSKPSGGGTSSGTTANGGTTAPPQGSKVQGTVNNAGLTGLYGSLPPVGTPSVGGTITIAQATGQTPTYIMPIVPVNNSSVYGVNMINDLFLPLYDGPTGSTPALNPALNMATAPVFSAGDKTVTFSIKPGYKWSDGKPVDANDVIFFIDIVKAAVKESAANFGAYTPGLFPDNVVSATAQGADTVVMKLTKAYNPGYFLNDQLVQLYAMPSTVWNVAATGGASVDYTKPANAKKIYDYLNKQGAAVASFGTNPLWKVVDGPFKLASFSATNGDYDLVPNPTYAGTIKSQAATVKYVTYTSITAQLNALKSHAVDISQIDASQLGQVASLRNSGYYVYGYPGFGFFSAFFNFKDKAGDFNNIIAQLYVRQALAHLVDQAGYVKGIFKNAAGEAYGPVPSEPVSPYTPPDAINTPYPFSISTAKQIMTSHGWAIVNGALTCETPGTAATQCGAGIPKGTPFAFTWFYVEASETPSSGLESESFASDAKQIGINVKLTAKTFNFLYANYDDANPADAKYTNDWGVNNFGGFTQDDYPTTNSIFNTTGSYNLGAYNDATANKLINASVFGSNPSAVKAEASYLTANLPALFEPNNDIIWAVAKTIGAVPDGFTSMTSQFEFPQYFYVDK
jgi:peptide/nickel transport system substrate-binding protein